MTKKTSKLKRVTKKATRAFVKIKIATNEQWMLNSLLKIYEYQTASEKAIGETYFTNGVGFSGLDSRILSSLAQQYKSHKWMSLKQKAIAFKLMPKYYQQIINISDKVKLEKLVRESNEHTV